MDALLKSIIERIGANLFLGISVVVFLTAIVLHKKFILPKLNNTKDIKTKRKLEHQKEQMIVDISQSESSLLFPMPHNNKFGLINTNGKWVIRPQFNKIKPLEGSNLFGASIDGERLGIIDNKGNWVIEPIFEDIANFHDGLAIAKRNGKYGFVDTKGTWLIQPIFENMYKFHDGLAGAKLGDKYGFIDSKGTWVIQPIFKYIGNFQDGKAVVSLSEGKLGLIDKSGTIKHTIVSSYSLTHLNGEESGGVFKIIQSGGDSIKRYGVIDIKGNWVIQPILEDIGNFHDGLAIAEIDGHWGDYRYQR